MEQLQSAARSLLEYVAALGTQDVIDIASQLVRHDVVEEIAGALRQMHRDNLAGEVLNLVAIPIVGRYLDLRESSAHDEAVNQTMQELVLAITEPDTPVALTAPLLHCDSDVSRLDVSPGMAIERLDDRERQTLIEKVGMRPGILDASHAIRVRARFAIEWDMPALLDQARELLTCVRLLCGGGASIPVAWLRSERLVLHPFGHLPAVQPDVPYFASNTRLETEDEGKLATLLRLRRSAAALSAVETAVRRFDFALSRRMPEDQLVDRWVAFEALVVPDGTTELRYRASLRVARALGRDPEERRAIFQQCRSSYDLRSRIVHGGGYDHDAARESAEQVGELLREAAPSVAGSGNSAECCIT